MSDVLKMSAAEYAVMAAAEDDHWWYWTLRALVVESLARLGVASDRARIVDAGCGTGGCYRAVRARFPRVAYVGFDVEPTALGYCRQRGLSRLIRASVNEVPLRSACADVVICLDVLYFASICPRKALGQFHATLKPHGLLVLNLPAFNVLRGRHDLAVGIPRRFRQREVRSLVEEAGFVLVKVTYWNTLLFLPTLAWRWVSRLHDRAEPASDVMTLPAWVNPLLRALLALEVLASRWTSLPFGSSLFLLAQKA